MLLCWLQVGSPVVDLKERSVSSLCAHAWIWRGRARQKCKQIAGAGSDFTQFIHLWCVQHAVDYCQC